MLIVVLMNSALVIFRIAFWPHDGTIDALWTAGIACDAIAIADIGLTFHRGYYEARAPTPRPSPTTAHRHTPPPSAGWHACSRPLTRAPVAERQQGHVAPSDPYALRGHSHL